MKSQGCLLYTRVMVVMVVWRARRIGGEELVKMETDVLEHEVQRHLPLAAGAVADVKQSVEKEGGKS